MSTENVETGNAGQVAEEEERNVFGVLKRFEGRAIFFKNTSGLVGTLDHIRKAYGLEGERIDLEDEEIDFGDYTRKYKYFVLPGLGRIYTFLLQNEEMAGTYAGHLFDLNSVKKWSFILYWHPYAMNLTSIGKFKNFYPIVWHNNEDVEAYIAKKLFFNDEKELLYYMQQVQHYMEERIKTRRQYRDDSLAKKEEIREKREARREERRNDDDSGSDEKPRHREQRDRRPRDTRHRNRRSPSPRRNERTAKPQKSEKTKPTRRAAPAKQQGAWRVPQEAESDEDVFLPEQEGNESKEVNPVFQQAPPQAPFYGGLGMFQQPFFQQPIPQAPQLSAQQMQQMAALMSMWQQQQQQPPQSK